MNIASARMSTRELNQRIRVLAKIINPQQLDSARLILSLLKLSHYRINLIQLYKLSQIQMVLNGVGDCEIGLGNTLFKILLILEMEKLRVSTVQPWLVPDICG